MDTNVAWDSLPAPGATAYINKRTSRYLSHYTTPPRNPTPCFASTPSSTPPLFQGGPGQDQLQVKISFRPEGWASRSVISILAAQ